MELFVSQFIQDFTSFLSWVAIVFGLMWIATEVNLQNKLKQLTKYENFSVYWFLVNGAIIHIMMDGGVGGFECFRPLSDMYKQMDRRFITRDHTVMIISYIELFVMGPLCLYIARMYLSSRSIKRSVLTLFISVIQFMGTVFFVFTEVLVDFKDYCGEEGCFSFTLDNIFYFWLAFVMANSVWFVVPIYYIRKSCQEISLLEFVSEKDTIDTSKKRK